MEMYRRNIRPRDIMTKEAVLNALTVDMALAWHYDEKKDEISERVLKLTRDFPLYE